MNAGEVNIKERNLLISKEYSVLNEETKDEKCRSKRVADAFVIKTVASSVWRCAPLKA
jgi:hypothetical protein